MREVHSQTHRLRRLSSGAAVVLAVYLGLRTMCGPVVWPFSILEPVLFWVCLPSIALLVFALVRRQWGMSAVHASIVGVWIGLFGHLLIAPRELAPIRGATLDVLSFNVGAGVASHAQIVELLRREDADVVLVQELSADDERAFADDLLDVYPHRDLHGLGIEGLGIFSKFPIVEREWLRLEASRAYQRVVLDVRGERTTILNVHPGVVRLLVAPWTGDASDFARLASAATEAGTAMIGGDFNATENMDLCRPLAKAGMRDAFRDAGRGLGLTFPVFGRYRGLPIPPMARIDFVWHTAAYACREARVLDDAGSDHFPLRVVLERR